MVLSLWDHYLVFAFFFSPSVISFRFPKTSVQSDVNCDLTTWSWPAVRSEARKRPRLPLGAKLEERMLRGNLQPREEGRRASRARFGEKMVSTGQAYWRGETGRRLDSAEVAQHACH